MTARAAHLAARADAVLSPTRSIRECGRAAARQTMPESEPHPTRASSCDPVVDSCASNSHDSAWDETLIRRMARGDVPALGLLYDRWSDVLYDRALNMGLTTVAAESLVESAFWESWVRADTYDNTCERPRRWLLTQLLSLTR